MANGTLEGIIQSATGSKMLSPLDIPVSFRTTIWWIKEIIIYKLTHSCRWL